MENGLLAFQLSDVVALFESISAAEQEWAEAIGKVVAEQGEFEGFEWPQ